MSSNLEVSPVDALAAEFERVCQSSETPPDAIEFLKLHPEASVESRLAVLMADIPRRVLNDSNFRIEHYLQRMPALDSNPDFIYKLLIQESEIRQARGEHLDSHEFQRRFPVIWDRLSDLMSGEKAPNLSNLSKPGPEAAGGTAVPPAAQPSSFADTYIPPEGADALKTQDPSGLGAAPDRSTAIPLSDVEPSTTPDQPTAPDPLKVIGQIFQARYRVTKLLGGGGMGFVYAARDLRFDRQDNDAGLVAIKFMRTGGASSQDGFRREAHLMRQFRHANFVEVYDYGVTAAQLSWLVMEYLPGSSVEQLLQRHKNKLPPEMVIKFIKEVCPALQSAHSKNLVHRDLKPANIMLAFEDTPDACFKILDFGLSTRTDASDSLVNRTMNTAGTPAYMAPEQIKGEPITARADIYSLGIILFRLLTGHMPLPGGDAQAACYNHVFTPPRHFDEVARNHGYPPEVEAVILQCLEKTPDKRPQTVAEIQERLIGALEPKEVEIVPASRLGWWVSGIAVALLAAAIPLAMRSALAPPPMNLELSTEPQLIDLASRDSIDVTITAAGLPEGAKFEVDAPAPTIGAADPALEVKTKPGARTDQYVVSLRARPNATPVLHPVALSAIVKQENEEPHIESYSVPVRVVWLPEGFARQKDAKVENVGDNFYYTRIERQVGKEKVTFVLVPEVKGASGNTFYIMQDKVWRGLFSQFLDSDLNGVPPTPKQEIRARKSAIREEWAKDGNHDQWPATFVTPDEAYYFAKWLGGPAGNLPTADQWDRASGFEFQEPGSTHKPELWDPIKYKRGPFDNVWNPQKNSEDIALTTHRDVGKSRMDVSFYGCRDMAGNGYEFVNKLSQDRIVSSLPISDNVRSDIDRWLIEIRGQAVGQTLSLHPAMYGETGWSAEYPVAADLLTSFRAVINP